MLIVKDVVKTFNHNTVNEKTALDNFSLKVAEGEFLTVIGGNGSGKTTLLNVIAGIYPVERGSIIISGADVTKLPEYKRAPHLGRVFQDPMMGTAGNMNIEENLALALRRGQRRTLRWGITAKDRESFREKLALLDLGLENRMTTKVGLLSGGQRQALTLLMATLRQPKLLLLDEHTAALDPKTALTVLELTEKIISRSRLTALMVTHNMRDAISYGNRVIMMDGGKTVFEASGEEKKKLTLNDMLEKFSVAGLDVV